MRPASAPRFLLVLLTLAPLLLNAACARRMNLRSSLADASLNLQGGPELLAIYQPWFGSKEHIDVGYSSHDRVVLQRQIEQARNLGIAGFVVNWYGPHKEFMDQSYALLQDIAAGNDFKVAVQYDEPVDYPGRTTDAVLADLTYLYDRYLGPNAVASRSAYLHYNGRPVIFIFPKDGQTDWNRVRQAVNSWQDPPLLFMKDINTRYAPAFDGFYAWVQPGQAGWQSNGGNWGERYLQDFYSRMKADYPDKIAVGAAWPGFNDKRASWSQNRYMDARCGRTFDDSLRVFRRYYNDSNPLPFLLIETWNDYEEGTAIERGLNTCSGGGGGAGNSVATAAGGGAK